MTTTLCPLCNKNAEHITLESYYDPGSVQTYTLHECSNCKAQYWTPLKNPGSEWYEHDYRYDGLNKDPILKPIWNHRKAIDFLKPQTGKVFDIGCGTGSFLFNAKNNGWETYGIDFDRNAVEAAKTVFHIENVEVNDLPGYAQKNNNQKYDLITYFDVFEHIDNHNDFIETIKSMLVDKGHIAMCMPYRGAAMWLRPHDLPPRHLTRWDRTSLRTFLEAHGFAVRYITRRSEGIGFVVLKLRFKFGKYLSFNLVNRVKKSERKEGKIEIGSKAEKRISYIQMLAKLKDYIVFGIPATLIWLCMLPTRKRYITLYAIAQKK